ncbi:MAG: ABC transporter substrate-binding protein [Gallionella sp.]|nr:ABC transporter substrate-binding protein [Gallionella sp.]
MKQWIKILVSLMCWVGIAHADIMAPDELIKSTSDEVIAIIKQDKDIQSGNQQKIVALVDEKLLPHFNFQRMTQLAVGKAWRTATPEQKQTLITEFHNLLVRTYAKAFSSYRDQSVDVKPLRMSDADDEVTVKTNIIKPNGSALSVNYEMQKTKDGWKVFDLYIEGAGLVPTYRNSFSTEIEKGGLDGLIKVLKEKNSSATKGNSK